MEMWLVAVRKQKLSRSRSACAPHPAVSPRQDCGERLGSCEAPWTPTAQDPTRASLALEALLPHLLSLLMPPALPGPEGVLLGRTHLLRLPILPQAWSRPQSGLRAIKVSGLCQQDSWRELGWSWVEPTDAQRVMGRHTGNHHPRARGPWQQRLCRPSQAQCRLVAGLPQQGRDHFHNREGME